MTAIDIGSVSRAIRGDTFQLFGVVLTVASLLPRKPDHLDARASH
jgi:hypothetical protein